MKVFTCWQILLIIVIAADVYMCYSSCSLMHLEFCAVGVL